MRAPVRARQKWMIALRPSRAPRMLWRHFAFFLLPLLFSPASPFTLQQPPVPPRRPLPSTLPPLSLSSSPDPVPVPSAPAKRHQRIRSFATLSAPLLILPIQPYLSQPVTILLSIPSLLYLFHLPPLPPPLLSPPHRPRPLHSVPPPPPLRRPLPLSVRPLPPRIHPPPHLLLLGSSLLLLPAQITRLLQPR